MTKSQRYNKKAVDKQLTRNGVTKPKAKKLTHKFLKGHQKADESVMEADVVDFSAYAGQYADGAHIVVRGRDGKSMVVYATGDTPRQYFINDQEVSWDDVKKAVGNAKVYPRQGRYGAMDEASASDLGVSDADRNPSMKNMGRYRTKPGKPSQAAIDKRDREAGMAMDAMTIAKRKKERAMFGESQINEGVLDDHDDDGFMAKRQLYDLAKYSVMLHKMIQDSDNLEPWVQAKITKAADYIDTVKHYMEYQGVRDAEDVAADMGAPDMDIDAMDGELAAMEPAIPQEDIMEFGDDDGSQIWPEDVLRWASNRKIISPETYERVMATDGMEGDPIWDAASDTADWIGSVDEVGSSDVSIWLKDFVNSAHGYKANLDGGKAHLYENAVKAKSMYKKMLKPLRGMK